MDVKLICLDFVGTVAKFSPDVVSTYHAFGTRFGSHLTLEQIRSNYNVAFTEAFGQPADEPVNQQWSVDAWRHVVTQTISDITDVDDALFDALWNHFASMDAWSCAEISKQ